MDYKTEEIQTNPLEGLTEKEVKQRRLAGQGNNIKLKTSRSYLQIIQENIFTFINIAFFAISLVFFLLKRYSDGLLVVVVIFGGILINIYQEIWAKNKLDQIALLNLPKANVIREAKEQNIDPSDIVVGDILPIRSGDQILVDGFVIGEGQVEVDESLLTGESDRIAKIAGDRVYSGSFCVSGNACYQAEKVGAETVAYKLVSGARSYRQILTPLQKEINLIIRVFFLIACFLWLLVGISFLTKDHSFNDVIQRFAVIAGLVPSGLLIAITLAYGLGAVRMLGQDVLIQQANAVESLSNINVLCLDKTGTLTTNQIELQEIYPIGISEQELRKLLGDYAASTSAGNKTTEAIAATCQGKNRHLKTEAAFSSERKWSALVFYEEEIKGTYVLGAPEILAINCPLDKETEEYIKAGTLLGMRVILFAVSEESDSLYQQKLPQQLKPLGIIKFSDILRKEAKETLAGFTRAGVEIKIISGDHPETVAALAKQAGLTPEGKVVSGQELALMDEAQFAQTAENNTIFGRITPEQKAMLVKALRQDGYYVAMTGDGVNDVLSLKQANLAIAMESGSKATRSIADIVLLKDSFASLPHALLEGQRIRNGVLDALKLFMVRGIVVTLLIFSLAVVTDSFPLENKQSALLALIAVGFPNIVTPIWAKSGKIASGSMMRSMLHFILPASLTLSLVALMIYLLYLVVAILGLPPEARLDQIDRNVPRSALVSILIMCQLLLIPFLKPPTTAWVGGEPISGDWRYTITSLILLALYFIIIAIPPLRQFFGLVQLSLNSHLFIGLVALEWCLIVRFIWRSKLLDKFLGVDLS